MRIVFLSLIKLMMITNSHKVAHKISSLFPLINLQRQGKEGRVTSCIGNETARLSHSKRDNTKKKKDIFSISPIIQSILLTRSEFLREKSPQNLFAPSLLVHSILSSNSEKWIEGVANMMINCDNKSRVRCRTRTLSLLIPLEFLLNKSHHHHAILSFTLHLSFPFFLSIFFLDDNNR